MAEMSADQLKELLELTREVDSVELKVSVPARDHGTATRNLGLDPIEAEIRQVFFFDTPDLRLNKAGIVARARRRQGGTADTVVKLRPVVPDELPKEFRKSASMKVEVDIMPGGFVCSASMKGKSKPDKVKRAAAGEEPLKEIFSREQEEFFKAYAPEGMDFKDLITLGPILTLKLEYPEPELGRDFVAEAWFYPDQSQLLELSTKCEPKEAFQVGGELKIFLLTKGIDLAAEQQTKTKTALEIFSARLS